MRWTPLLFVVSFASLTFDLPEIKVLDHGPASLWLNRPADDPFSVKLSEKLTISMRVEGETPLEVELTEKVRSTSGWQLEALGKPVTTKLDSENRVRWQQTFVATPLQPGTHPLQLPALQFSASGGPEQKISWEPLRLEIKTRVAKLDVTEARDRTGIEELPPPPEPRPWWPWLLTAVPVLATLFLVLWRRRRAKPVPESPPQNAALRQLDELGQQQIHGADDLKSICAGLSDVLRSYAEKSFRLPATRLTTAEFLAALAKTWPQDGEHQQMLADILNACDLAKFAEILPAQPASHQLIAAARQFVEKTAATRHDRRSLPKSGSLP
jgi:hypothetical protein